PVSWPMRLPGAAQTTLRATNRFPPQRRSKPWPDLFVLRSMEQLDCSIPTGIGGRPYPAIGQEFERLHRSHGKIEGRLDHRLTTARAQLIYKQVRGGGTFDPHLAATQAMDPRGGDRA